LREERQGVRMFERREAGGEDDERRKPSVSETVMSFLRSEATRNPLHKNNGKKLMII